MRVTISSSVCYSTKNRVAEITRLGRWQQSKPQPGKIRISRQTNGFG